jgi:anti-sigma-K factor RskA
MNKAFITCLLTAWLLTGCTVSLDPLGMTERAQIRANAAVQIEQQRTLARQAEAQATVDAEAERQAGANHRAATWALILPVLAIVAGATVAVCLVLNWKGRIAHEQLRLQYTQRPMVVYIEAAPRSEYQLLRDYARSHGGELTFAGGRPFVALPGGQRLLIDKGAL